MLINRAAKYIDFQKEIHLHVKPSTSDPHASSFVSSVVNVLMVLSAQVQNCDCAQKDGKQQLVQLRILLLSSIPMFKKIKMKLMIIKNSNKTLKQIFNL